MNDLSGIFLAKHRQELLSDTDNAYHVGLVNLSPDFGIATMPSCLVSGIDGLLSRFLNTYVVVEMLPFGAMIPLLLIRTCVICLMI